MIYNYNKQFFQLIYFLTFFSLNFTYCINASTNEEKGNKAVRLTQDKFFYYQEKIKPSSYSSLTSSSKMKNELQDPDIDTKSPDDLFKLGRRYYNGEEVIQDKEKAYQLFKKAANQDHAEAQFETALCLENGEGVARNIKKAAKYYQIAANQGYAQAQFKLGEFFDFEEEGLLIDHVQAVEWYKRAANQGHPKAQYNLAVLYYFGNGIAQNDKKCKQLLKSSAKKGYNRAQYGLGLYFENVHNWAKALEWMKKAAENGSSEAREWMENAALIGEPQALIWVQEVARRIPRSAPLPRRARAAVLRRASVVHQDHQTTAAIPQINKISETAKPVLRRSSTGGLGQHRMREQP
ncbi:MAG: sel1 repeat family protein [Alphaproteobacteria bacterium]|nr:sel1 repeat family protein [Alphaproteobacteria bacterium]